MTLYVLLSQATSLSTQNRWLGRSRKALSTGQMPFTTLLQSNSCVEIYHHSNSFPVYINILSQHILGFFHPLSASQKDCLRNAHRCELSEKHWNNRGAWYGFWATCACSSFWFLALLMPDLGYLLRNCCWTHQALSIFGLRIQLIMYCPDYMFRWCLMIRHSIAAKTQYRLDAVFQMVHSSPLQMVHSFSKTLSLQIVVLYWDML